MDAPDDDQDVILQKTSSGDLAELKKSLKPFLWKNTPSGPRIRSRVRVRDLTRLVNLLEPFQELPQLLDPHLDAFIPVLADAFISFLRSPSPRRAPDAADLLTPLSYAICKLLYTFCKIRGEKVIVRFLDTDMRYLELLLSAVVKGNQSTTGTTDHIKSGTENWEWEETYIALLWLSQLLLAPFDLSTISSTGTVGEEFPSIPGLVWPANTPVLTIRVLHLAIRHLSASGKERDAAKIVLVRVAMRRDMQKIGILDALVQWTISSLRPSPNGAQSVYPYIGALSFLAGLLSSSITTTDMVPYIFEVFRTVQEISSSDTPAFKLISSSAVARKTIIKVLRSTVVLALQDPDTEKYGEMLGEIITELLDSLGDKATPVRLAASKALSIIAVKLDVDMKIGIIEETLYRLKLDVFWNTRSDGTKTSRNLSRVDQYKWHGLILTLSHFLYRHSAPTETLSQVIPALFLGLSFEQHSPTGASIGTNVRDAACFGIWALARRYQTEELQSLVLDEVIGVKSDASEVTPSVLQTLANQLVVSSSLDSAGNVRRGCSAALQELIGRHPDTIAEGISVVQVVDYHAVARRSRAIGEVAVRAANLSEHYRRGLLNDLLGWRGAKDADIEVRRSAAIAAEKIVWSKTLHGSIDMDFVRDTVSPIATRIMNLERREAEERHGLLLCLSSILGHGQRGSIKGQQLIEMMLPLGLLLNKLEASFSQLRGPELLAEATSLFLVPFFKLLRQDLDTISDEPALGVPLDGDLLNTISKLLSKFMEINDDKCAGAVADAVAAFLLFLDRPARQEKMSFWVDKAFEYKRSGTLQGNVYLHTVFRLLPITDSNPTDKGDKLSPSQFNPSLFLADRIVPLLQSLWEKTKTSRNIEDGVTILRCLATSTALDRHAVPLFENIICDGLNNYTKSPRGDVGSALRIEGMKAVITLIMYHPQVLGNTTDPLRDDPVEGKLLQRHVNYMIASVLRLSSEKLDKVRSEGQVALCYFLKNEDTKNNFQSLSTSSIDYFKFLLTLDPERDTNFDISAKEQWWKSLMEGFVTSAVAGSEQVVKASRAALVDVQPTLEPDLIPRILCQMLKHPERERRSNKLVIPILEALSFMLDVGIIPRTCLKIVSQTVLRPAKPSMFSGIKETEAVVKICGGLYDLASQANDDDCVVEQRYSFEYLARCLRSSYPIIRNLAADELWVRCQVGKKVNWLTATSDVVDDLIRRFDQKQRKVIPVEASVS